MGECDVVKGSLVDVGSFPAFPREISKEIPILFAGGVETIYVIGSCSYMFSQKGRPRYGLSPQNCFFEA